MPHERAVEARLLERSWNGAVANTGKAAGPPMDAEPRQRARPATNGDQRRGKPRNCHAGGRGFESRRSRKNPCKSAYCVVGLDARSAPTTHTLLEVTAKQAKTPENRFGSNDFRPGTGLSRSEGIALFMRFSPSGDARPGDPRSGLELFLHSNRPGRGPRVRPAPAPRAAKTSGCRRARASPIRGRAP
jgi:hypothetical protein